ncbi:Integrase core domain-containing protein, partial [Puniceibacterium sediminis]
MIMNEKKLYRIYREEGLPVCRRRGRKRARGSRTPMPVPLRPNQRWSLDFLSDTFGACRNFRILAVNDDCCRENLCLVPDTSISGVRVARELDALVRIYGKPACIVSDKGTEFTSKATLKWANDNKVEWHYIDPHSRACKHALPCSGTSRSKMVTSSPSTAACAPLGRLLRNRLP